MPRAKKVPRPEPVNDHGLWVQWRTDMERIYKENIAAFRNRLVFREVFGIVKRNERLSKEGGYFFRWLAGCYIRDQALAVRREVDDSPDAVNLTQLMAQMLRRPEVMSRARYDTHFPPDSVFDKQMRDEMFLRATGGEEFISKPVIGKDRRVFLAACDPVSTYVSKLIAHRTPIEELTLNIKQIDTALDAIEVVFEKYMVLLTGRSVMGLEPAVQFDWEEIFTYPWAPVLPDDDDA
jgi:hypothetical protein